MYMRMKSLGRFGGGEGVMVAVAAVGLGVTDECGFSSATRLELKALTQPPQTLSAPNPNASSPKLQTLKAPRAHQRDVKLSPLAHDGSLQRHPDLDPDPRRGIVPRDTPQLDGRSQACVAGERHEAPLSSLGAG